MKHDSQSHHQLESDGSVFFAPKRTAQDMHRFACDPEAGPIRGHGLPKSVVTAKGYPDSILTITTRKTDAFPAPARVLKAGKKK